VGEAPAGDPRGAVAGDVAGLEEEEVHAIRVARRGEPGERP